MTLEAGRDLLHYRIVDKIGEGGMGVVWRAEDTSLGREVAIKVLPPNWAGDAERLQRFEREARLLASLNHPNVATVHGLHEVETVTGPVRFIAMEYVPGEDLAARLGSGPLGLELALGTARRIARGLGSGIHLGRAGRSSAGRSRVSRKPPPRSAALSASLAALIRRTTRWSV